MQLRIQILLSLSALLVTCRATAQVLPASDFFHGGAQFYLSNNIPAALERVTNGLAIYPNDVKLKKLEELLKQQQQQQKQNQQQDQNTQDQQKNDQEKQKQDQEQQQKQSQDQQQAKQSEDKQEQEQVAPGQMTEQQAKQLLDAQKGHEQVLIFKPSNEKQKGRAKTLKDW